MGEDLASVFANAALPQKAVMVGLILAIFAALLLAATRRGAGSRFIFELRVAGPLLGLMVAAMNGFHIAQTILRLPSSPTARDLAPALMEMAVFVGLGALAGLVAVALTRAPR